MQYTLDLLGQRYRLSTPFELHIPANMAPFLRPGQDCSEFWIRVEPGYPVRPGENSRWCGTYFYEQTQSGGRTLHCHSAGTAPYAVTEFFSDGNIRLTYQAEFVSLIKNASTLLHLVGLESMMLLHGGLILHAAFVRKEGRGLLFTAPSGTGKSTQARLWEEHRGAAILNGDRAGLRLHDGQWRAWGLPYAGTSGIYRNESAPVGAIVVLRQGQENRIRRLTAAEAMRCCYPEITMHHWDQQFVECALDLMQSLIQYVPVFMLECLPDESAVVLLEQTLEKEGLL